ncbi:MAG TPA: DsrE family protein [Chryseosolibacter sp.]|nr:DsrE family protein [Chryseosolibacter sp.]
MKNFRYGLGLLMLFGAITAASAQDVKSQHVKKSHKVIMQVTEGDSLTQLAVIGQVRNIKKQLPDAQIEVVCHANSLDMLLRSGSKVASHIAELKPMGVNFMACENTMARKKATAADLVPGAGTVPSGLVEIILKQEEGWSYIKGGH